MPNTLFQNIAKNLQETQSLNDNPPIRNIVDPTFKGILKYKRHQGVFKFKIIYDQGEIK